MELSGYYYTINGFYGQDVYKRQEIGLLDLSIVLRNPTLPKPFEESLCYYARARTTEIVMITLSRKSFGDK